jgi:hypothetical protein
MFIGDVVEITAPIGYFGFPDGAAAAQDDGAAYNKPGDGTHSLHPHDPTKFSHNRENGASNKPISFCIARV